MSRSEIKPRISIEEVKSRWYEIYSRYTKLTLNGGKYNGLCPLHSEGSGSFYVFMDGGYKCFGCGEAGSNVVDFLMKKENLSFSDALIFASSNFNISAPSLVKTRKVKKEEPFIEIQKISFEQKHKDYWNKYLLPESYLNSEGIFAISKYAINKFVYNIPEDVATFAYEASKGKYKLLQIGNTDKKWINWVDNKYIWRENKIKDCSQLWVVKSLKDALVLNYHCGLCTVALQNESADIFIKENADRLEKICKNIVIALGSDPQGKAESIKITKSRGYKWWNTPNYMYNYGIEDSADLVDQMGIGPLKELVNKKLIQWQEEQK